MKYINANHCYIIIYNESVKIQSMRPRSQTIEADTIEEFVETAKQNFSESLANKAFSYSENNLKKTSKTRRMTFKRLQLHKIDEEYD
jgi:hypothetical protein